MAFKRTRLRDPGKNRIAKFSKNKIAECSAKAVRERRTIEYTDSLQEGLKLVAYQSGKVGWRHRWTDRGTRKKCFYTIGCAFSISPDQAREYVRQRVARIALGLNPDADEAASCPMMTSFIEEDYLEHARRKYKSRRDIENRVNNWIKPRFGDVRLNAISKADVIRFQEEVHDKVSATTANRTVSLLSSILKRAVDLDLIQMNPCQGVKKLREGESRDRFLDDGEFERFLKVLRGKLDQPPAQAIFLLISLGLRKSEILSSRWSNIDLAQKSLYIPDPKNRKPRYVALNSQAHALLSRMYKARDTALDWVFPSGSAQGHLLEVRRTFARILEEADISGFRLHDLRRTHASVLINAGASIYEVKDILGHRDLRSTQVYARLATSSLAKTSEIAAKKIEKALGHA